MNFCMTGHEKVDLLIQVTPWAGLNVYLSTIKGLQINSFLYF